MDPWIAFFDQILKASFGADFETQTESSEQIEQLNKSPCWRLKGIVSQIVLKLF